MGSRDQAQAINLKSLVPSHLGFLEFLNFSLCSENIASKFSMMVCLGEHTMYIFRLSYSSAIEYNPANDIKVINTFGILFSLCPVLSLLREAYKILFVHLSL